MMLAVGFTACGGTSEQNGAGKTVETFINALASAFMGALLLYSKSYALFFICAATFILISFCSIKLIKSEE
jgi:hypothetical protein